MQDELAEYQDDQQQQQLQPDDGSGQRGGLIGQQQQNQQQLPSWFVVKLTLIASLGGTIFGYDLGAVSGALPQLLANEHFALTSSQSEKVVSVLYVGGTVGALVGGSICDLFGRRTTILLTDVVFVIGASVLYYAQTFQSILLGRFVVGIGVAVSGIADVSYLHECSPAEWRGAIVSCNEACIALGFLLAYLAGYVHNDASKDDWRIIFGWAGVVAAVQFLGMLSLPESPAWLLERGMAEKAKASFVTINGTSSDFVPSYSTNEGEIGTNVDTSYGSSTRNPSSTSREQNPTVTTPNSKRGLRKRRSEDDYSGHDQQMPLSSSPSDDSVTKSSPHSLIIDDTKLGYSIGDSYQQASDSFDGDATFTQLPTFNSELSGWKNVRHRFQTIVSIISRYRRQCYIALYLAVVQQFCGQTNVLSYAPLIFAAAADQDNDGNGDSADATISSDVSGWSTISIGLVKFIVTVIVICKIERVGRRPLLIAGTSLIALGLLLLSVAFAGPNNMTGIDYNTNSDIASSSGTDNDTTDNGSLIGNVKTFHLALPGVLLVVSGYSLSFGPLTWLITSELFPTEIRGRALGLSTVITYIAAAITTRTFLSGQLWMGPSKLFGTYLLVTILGIIYENFAVPDTGGKTFDQVEQNLNAMPWWNVGTMRGGESRNSLVRHSTSLEMGSQSSLNNLT